MFSQVHRDEKGQTMAFIAVIALVLVFLWAMVVNIGTLERERIRMQNAVDAAALSAAVWQARGYNILGMVQNLALLAPPGFWFFVDTRLKSATDAMLRLEQAIYYAFGNKGIPYVAALSVATLNGADFLYPADINFKLDLKVHKGWILYWQWVDLWIIKFYFPAFWVRSCTDAGWFSSKRVWYMQGKGWKDGPKQTLRFVATKKYRPPLGGFFGLGEKTIYTVAEAKVYLNTDQMVFYEGGFPPQKGLWSILPLSRWPTFDAKLVPVKPLRVPLYLH